MKATVLVLLGCILNGNFAFARSCPDIESEAVSLCRAEVACGKGSAGRIFGAVLGGMGSGNGRNQAVDNYQRCIDNDLDAQRANASSASGNNSKDTTTRCKTVNLGNGESETKCHSE